MLQRADIFFYENNKYLHIARVDGVTGDIHATSENSAVVINSIKPMPPFSYLTQEQMDEWLKIDTTYGKKYNIGQE